MKRLLSGIISVAMLFSISVSAVAANSSISIKNNEVSSQPVSYTYEAGKAGEIVKSIKSLMTKLADVSVHKSAVQTLTITSESNDNSPVAVGLRLSIPETTAVQTLPEAISTPSPDEYSALDYYNLRITDKDGNVIYSDDDNNEKEYPNNYKEIPLGILNEYSGSESKIYNITLSVNKDMNTTEIKNNAQRLDWSIVSDTYTADILATPEPTMAVEVTVTEAPMPVSEPNSNISEDKNGVITLSKGEFLCGEDIEPGRYTMTGTGKVHVYTDEGVLKSTIALKNKNDSSAGVEQYIINLVDGERIEVEADVSLAPYTAAKPTTTPKVTNTPSSNAKATATPAAAASKTNPKTGDTAPIAFVSVLGILAIGAVVYIEIQKRKQN